GAATRWTGAPDAHADPEPAAAGHRLDAVHHDVREHLLDLALVEPREERAARPALEADLRALGRGRDQVERPAHQLLEIREPHRGAAPPREVEELLDDPRHAVRLLEDDPAARRRVGRRHPADEQLGARRDDVQRRAELVRDAGGELTHGREALAVTELLE